MTAVLKTRTLASYCFVHGPIYSVSTDCIFVWYYRTQLECSSYSHDPWPMSLQLQQPEIRTMCQNTY